MVEHEQLEARAHGGEVRVPARRELFAAAQVELLEPHGQAAARRREILERAVREARALRDAQRHEVLAEAARTQSYVCTDPSSRGSRMTAQEKRRIAGVQAGAGADALGDAPDGGVADGRAREVQVEQHRHCCTTARTTWSCARHGPGAVQHTCIRYSYLFEAELSKARVLRAPRAARSRTG